MKRGHSRGFTLVELLVALTIMAILSVLSWRGLDGMMRSQSQTRQYSDEVLVLQTGLAQWRTDLDTLAPASQIQGLLPGPLDWNGQAMRLVRRSTPPAAAGLQVVAWSRRDVDGTSQWLRWQSSIVRTRSELQTAWQQAGNWVQNPGPEDRKSEVAITPLLQWQIFFFRGGTWSNPLSSDGGAANAPPAAAASPGSASSVPDAMRLVLTMPPGRALGGTLTTDWVRPTLGGNKS
jgi:general secretion pathway protein J